MVLVRARAGNAALVGTARRAVAPRPALTAHRAPRRPAVADRRAPDRRLRYRGAAARPAAPATRDLGEFLSSHAGHTVLAGAWGWLAVLIVLWVFNTVLGEELLFRGYLLPRMNGVFGRRDWLANGVLFAVFAFYHLHMPWEKRNRAARGESHRGPIITCSAM